ncbi:MAG: HEAT repeat domain-containing protein [Archangium sp.]|nr:HEAT repeat domain-containing protein [Archangium sp.]
MSDEKPEALLKSALEKILYFEARSSQLTNDADTSRSELERFKADLAAASQREIELRRVVAELEVRVTRAHSEREETARLADALRRERADLVGKMLEASRIHGLEQGSGLDDFDLGQFIAQLRSEVIVQRGGTAPVLVGPAPTTSDTVAGVANELKSQGRLSVSANELATLTGAREFPGRSEETLFGFSVRELSAPDASARVRAAERLQALRHPAATPALATALHGESEPSVQVALLNALASLAKSEALPVVMPLLTSRAPEVRIAALKAMITLDAPAAAPHLAAATKDPDKAVRRRASLLALGLSGKEALELGTQAIRDSDADVRSLAALVLGASNAETARPLLMEAMRDVDLRVRRAASQSLSRLLGQDVTSLVSLGDAHRRREVRRLSTVPSKPVTSLAPRPVATAPAPAPVRVAAPVAAPMAAAAARTRVAVLEVEAVAPAAPVSSLLTSAMRELRASIRGRQLSELADGIGASTEETMKVCGTLMAQGQVVRRGLKYFVA